MSETYALGNVSQRTNPLRVLEVKILNALNAGGGGGGGTAQLVTYTVGTPAAPANQNQPALAYDPTGNLPTLGWNTSNHTWN